MAKFWKRKAVFFVKKKAPHNRFTGFLPSFPRSVVSPGCCCWMESSSRVCDRVIFLFFFFLPFLIFSRLGTPASRVVFPFCLLFPVCCSFSSNRRLNRRAIFQPKIQQKKNKRRTALCFCSSLPRSSPTRHPSPFSILLLLRLLLLLPFLTHLL